jgi:truncated hemoglobin YjbI
MPVNSKKTPHLGPIFDQLFQNGTFPKFHQILGHFWGFSKKVHFFAFFWVFLTPLFHRLVRVFYHNFQKDPVFLGVYFWPSKPENAKNRPK